MPNLQPIYEILPPAYRRALELAGDTALEELRLRIGHVPTAVRRGNEELLPLPSGGGLVTADDLSQLLLAATRQSCYAANETLKEGFVTIAGGHRIGVCGTAVARDEIMLVRDVHQFPGHIACDSASNSEIVLPIHKNGHIIGVLDIDSPILARFDETDREGLSEFVRILEEKL